MENKCIVYVKVDNSGYITEINSSAFLSDTTGWTEIDQGQGDKYHHAQGNYLPGPLMTVGGAYRYKLVNGKPVECTSEEIQEQEEANQPEPTPSIPEEVEALKNENFMLKAQIQAMSDRNDFIEDCIAEMAMQVYA